MTGLPAKHRSDEVARQHEDSRKLTALREPEGYNGGWTDKGFRTQKRKRTKMSDAETTRKYLHERGGSAFPLSITFDDGSEYRSSGLTARDWFATHAPEPPDWWSHEELKADRPKSIESKEAWAAYRRASKEWSFQRLVAWRFFYADAMLAERAPLSRKGLPYRHYEGDGASFALAILAALLTALSTQPEAVK